VDLNTAGFALSYVFVKDGRGSISGPYLYHIYGVTPDAQFDSIIAQLVTVNNSRQVQQVGFYGVVGSPAVPEGGVTLLFMGGAIFAIEPSRRTFLRRRV